MATLAAERRARGEREAYLMAEVQAAAEQAAAAAAAAVEEGGGGGASSGGGGSGGGGSSAKGQTKVKSAGKKDEGGERPSSPERNEFGRMLTPREQLLSAIMKRKMG